MVPGEGSMRFVIGPAVQVAPLKVKLAIPFHSQSTNPSTSNCEKVEQGSRRPEAKESAKLIMGIEDDDVAGCEIAFGILPGCRAQGGDISIRECPGKRPDQPWRAVGKLRVQPLRRTDECACLFTFSGAIDGPAPVR